MTTYYLDSNALIKRYVAEVGSRWLINLINTSPDVLLVTFRLTVVEVRGVLARRKRESSLRAQSYAEALAVFLENTLSQYRFVEFDPGIADLAGELLERSPLRAYDSIQLASALQVSRVLEAAGLAPPVFLSADDRLLEAAEAENLPTDNPNQHPIADLI